MNLLARLRLAYQVLTTRRARDWRRVVATCEQARSAATLTEIMAAIDQDQAIEDERAQVAAGTRTTRQSAALLAEAQRLIQPKAKP